MRLDARRTQSFLRDPGGCRVVLLYGDDHGLIRERADALVRSVLGATDDPFRLVDLERDRITDLPAEAASLPLTGGRRVIRCRDLSDSAAAVQALKAVLAGVGPALVVLEAPALPSRSKLRAMLEPAPDAVAISCYAEVGHALEASLAALLAEAGVRAEADALDWLKTHLGADRAMQRQAAETLALLVGPGGTVRLSDVAACLGDAASFSMEDAAFAAGLGEEAALDRALGHALAEGMAPVGALRAAMAHFQRLHRARIMVDLGMPPEQAIRGLRPPVFWKGEAAFRATLGVWSAPRLAAALASLQKAERGCKRTGAPADTICRAALQRVGHQARLLRNPASASREQR